MSVRLHANSDIKSAKISGTLIAFLNSIIFSCPGACSCHLPDRCGFLGIDHVLTLIYTAMTFTKFSIIEEMWKTILIILALLYALSPYDLLPDFMIGWGWLDDLVVLGLLARYLYRQKKKREAFQNYYKHQQNTHDNDRNKSNNAKGPYGHKDSGEFSHLGDPYKILGIDRSASQEDIKRAYRALAGKYHPDKVEHLGEEFKELAENRFKDIQRAYDELRR